MKTATVIQTLGFLAVWAALVAVFGFWTFALVVGGFLLAIGIGLERKAVDGG